MDSTNTLIIINLLLNLFQVIDHFFNRLRSSKCFLGELQMKESNNDNNEKDIENQIKNHKESQDKIIEQLKNLINIKPDDIIKNQNNDNPSNKL